MCVLCVCVCVTAQGWISKVTMNLRCFFCFPLHLLLCLPVFISILTVERWQEMREERDGERHIPQWSVMLGTLGNLCVNFSSSWNMLNLWGRVLTSMSVSFHRLKTSRLLLFFWIKINKWKGLQSVVKVKKKKSLKPFDSTPCGYIFVQAGEMLWNLFL